MRKLTWAALTDVGMKRSGNEDAFIVAEDFGLYVVCDGMGGHASGEIASAMTTEEIVAFLRERAAGDHALPYDTEEGATLPEQVLSNAIQHANDKVYVAGMRDPKYEGMGTTVVAVQEVGDDFVLAHIGDSRIYRYRNGALEQLTRDHSLLNHKIDMGELRTEEEIKAFKHGNIIVRAIGLKDYVRPEAQTVDRQPGDLLLLCTDGITDLVDDWAIENVLEANYEELEEAAQILIRMANDRGGKDNSTVILLRVDDEDEYDYGDSDFHEERTVPHGVAALADDDSTDPGRDRFDASDLEDDEDDFDFQDITASDDSRTAPHTPAFMWDDLAEDASEGTPDDPFSQKGTLKLGGDELARLRSMRPGTTLPQKQVPRKPPAQHRAPNARGAAPDDADPNLPSIIIDES